MNGYPAIKTAVLSLAAYFGSGVLADSDVHEVIKASPQIIGLIAIVYLFIRYLGNRDKLYAEVAKEQAAATRLLAVALDRNTDALEAHERHGRVRT